MDGSGPHDGVRLSAPIAQHMWRSNKSDGRGTAPRARGTAVAKLLYMIAMNISLDVHCCIASASTTRIVTRVDLGVSRIACRSPSRHWGADRVYLHPLGRFPQTIKSCREFNWKEFKLLPLLLTYINTDPSPSPFILSQDLLK